MPLLDEVRKLEQQVVARLKELEPLTREYDQLRKLAERLGVKYSPGSTETHRRGEAVNGSPPQRRPRARRRAAREYAREDPSRTTPGAPARRSPATRYAINHREAGGGQC